VSSTFEAFAAKSFLTQLCQGAPCRRVAFVESSTEESIHSTEVSHRAFMGPLQSYFAQSKSTMVHPPGSLSPKRLRKHGGSY
jgi:hypothetical protein